MIKEKTIYIKNIYYMLSYAFTILRQSNFKDIEKEVFDNIHNLFSAILAKGIGHQLKQGLNREYRNYQDDLSVLRGKILIRDSVKNQFCKKRQLACNFDELSENNLLNQILKMTGRLLLNHPNVAHEYKDDLKKKMLFFSNVDLVDPTTVKWSSIRFQRNNQSYRMLISICQLIIEGMLLTTEHGIYKLASFINDQCMSRLFQKFVYEFYIKEYPEIKTSASQIPWALDDSFGSLLPIMQSDIMLTWANSVLIIDTKFYSRTTQTRYDSHTIHSSNLYQIFTYVKNMDLSLGNKPHEVSGMLLYAQTDESMQLDHTFRMSGNKISVKTLDLNRDFIDIAAQLNAIGDNLKNNRLN